MFLYNPTTFNFGWMKYWLMLPLSFSLSLSPSSLSVHVLVLSRLLIHCIDLMLVARYNMLTNIVSVFSCMYVILFFPYNMHWMQRHQLRNKCREIVSAFWWKGERIHIPLKNMAASHKYYWPLRQKYKLVGSSSVLIEPYLIIVLWRDVFYILQVHSVILQHCLIKCVTIYGFICFTFHRFYVILRNTWLIYHHVCKRKLT